MASPRRAERDSGSATRRMAERRIALRASAPRPFVRAPALSKGRDSNRSAASMSTPNVDQQGGRVRTRSEMWVIWYEPRRGSIAA